MTLRTPAPTVGLLVAIGALLLAACTDDQEAAPPAQPDLQCVGDEKEFNPPDQLDISGPGAATADAALRARLERKIATFGTGNVVALSNTEYGLEVDGRLVAIHRAVTNDDGDWHVVDDYYCSTDQTGAKLVLADSQ